MKKRSKEAALLDGIIMELHEVKCHIANERPFEAGVGLGGLLNALCYKLEKCEGKNEEVQGEESDEECEEGSEEEDDDNFDWEAAHDSVEEENCSLRKDLKEIHNRFDKLFRTHSEIKNLIRNLIRNDHIFPQVLDSMIRELARLDETETVDDLYRLQKGTTIRMPV